MANLSLVQVAEHYGVHRQTVTAWVNRGMPYLKKGGTGKQWEFDSVAVAEWKEEQAVLDAVGNVTKATEEELKRRKLAAETSVVEIDAAKARGEVVVVEDVAAVVRDDYISIKARLRNIPQRVAPLIVGERNENSIKVEIEREIDDALTELSNRFIEVSDESEESTERGEAVSQTAA